jgi:hypothetical protein
MTTSSYVAIVQHGLLILFKCREYCLCGVYYLDGRPTHVRHALRYIKADRKMEQILIRPAEIGCFPSCIGEMIHRPCRPRNIPARSGALEPPGPNRLSALGAHSNHNHEGGHSLSGPSRCVRPATMLVICRFCDRARAVKAVIQRAGPCFCPWSADRHMMRTKEAAGSNLYHGLEATAADTSSTTLVPARDLSGRCCRSSAAAAGCR